MRNFTILWITIYSMYFNLFEPGPVLGGFSLWERNRGVRRRCLGLFLALSSARVARSRRSKKFHSVRNLGHERPTSARVKVAATSR